MKTMKKLLAFVIATTMLVGSVPTSVFAAEAGSMDEAILQEQEDQYAAEQAAAEEAARIAAEQAAAEEAARIAAEQAAAEQAAAAAAEQAAAQQQAIDEASSSEPQGEVWQAVDEAVTPEATSESAAEEVAEEAAEEGEKEIAYPAALFKDIDLGDQAKLTVAAEEGVLPEGTQIRISALTAQEQTSVAALLKGALGKDAAGSQSFHISFYNNKGENIVPKGQLSITMNNVKLAGNMAGLYAVNGGKIKNLVPMKEKKANDRASFTVKTAEYELIVAASMEKEEAAGEATPAADQNAKEEKADDDDSPEPRTQDDVEANAEQILANARAGLMRSIDMLMNANGMQIASDTNAQEDTTEEPTAEPEAAAPVLPAFNASRAIAGTGMKVSVEAPEGAFPEGIQLFAGVVTTPAEVLAAIENESGEAVAQEDALSIDIHFYLPEDPNTEIEPLVPISVTFANIDLDAEVVDVYHETEKVAEVEGEGGTV